MIKAVKAPKPRARKAAPRPSARAWARHGSSAVTFAFGLSILLHVVVLSLHFEFPDLKKAFKRDSGLEVVLVNARHARAPDKAEALAQANLDGGGNTDAKQMASTPVPPKPQQKDGDQLMDAKRKVQELEAAQRKLVADAKKARPTTQTVVKNSDAPAETPRELSATELMDSAAAIARLEAKIDKNLNEYAKRPRKKFIGARTKEYRFAQYVEDWRLKIERVGTLNYPDSARGKLYGSLLMSVVIRADGSVESINIHRSSGHSVLDNAARRIVELAAPFSAFPANIRKDTDIVEITRTWSFTNADAIETSSPK
ncbi:MAG TPA: TonB family protein [Denitromonas sp.]|uniref:energy transducer TonB n=1 Tax=Denitromonas sp. TaxID=2734609 RepID=UPI001E0E209A|nr:energy transducer TonB [Rhodocyclaceae bacterium]MCP5221257.1 energy transducer TonB [Zoogloeaceae bacterium]HPR05891.1 TonB family protein [Denitromonas sp.]HQV15148.1 TonB family protein [Denitromonas sp.]